MRTCVYLFVMVLLFWQNSATKTMEKIKTAVINAAEKVNTTISIYYDSLGTRSVSFMLEQFYPAYILYGDKIDIDLIPFGKAKINNASRTIDCHHGPMECYGNKAQACAIFLYSSKISTEFVICAMKSGDASLEENLEMCGADNNVTWSKIRNCIKSGKGDELLYKNGIRTFSVRPVITFIPTVIFNHVYDEVLQKLSLEDFQEIIEFLVNESDCTTCHKLNGSDFCSGHIILLWIIISVYTIL